MVKAKEARVYVNVSGLTGTGKSAVLGEIEIALRALGVPVEHDTAFQAEKNATHADWQAALDLYKPTVILSETNISRAAAPVVSVGGLSEAFEKLETLLAVVSDRSVDCADIIEPFERDEYESALKAVVHQAATPDGSRWHVMAEYQRIVAEQDLTEPYWQGYRDALNLAATLPAAPGGGNE